MAHPMVAPIRGIQVVALGMDNWQLPYGASHSRRSFLYVLNHSVGFSLDLDMVILP